ncbi:twin transmembrane helix small protein [Rhodoferax sp.]|uniref:twin transmembrane helix small protein n=1 Tax=Rhodoferax sp. TaxID=50421 RepID=UPI00374DD81E
MTYLALAAFAAIFASLGAALYFMLKGGDKTGTADAQKAGRMAKALAFRIGFSVLLFICILVGWKLGYLHPTGIPVGK